MRIVIEGTLGLSRMAEGHPRLWKVVESPVLYVGCGWCGVNQIHRASGPLSTTDGASVPRALWWLASPLSGRHAAASVFHDLHYATHLVSKDLADEIFYHGMLFLGVNKVKAWLLYQAVKWFGGSSYDHDKMTPLMYPEDYLKVEKFYGDTT